MMKKIVTLLMACTMMLALASCANEEIEDSEGKGMDLTATESDDTSATEDKEVVDENKEIAEESIEEVVQSLFTNLPEHIYKIGQQEFVDRVKAGDDMVIIDIRSAEDYGKNHVQGAINLPWGKTAISDNLTKIPQDKEVMIYCYSGQTAGQTVLLMNAAGINARSVNLGFNFGISKVEGVEEIFTTQATEFGSETYEVATNMQEAVDEYYKGLGEVKETKFANYKVAEAELKTMIENNEDFYLLSARSAEDYGNAHIKGAKNVPYGTTMIENLSSVPKDKKVVVYCYSGQTAGQATAAMRLLGYDAVSLNGGMGVKSNAPLGWINKGYTVVSSSTVYNGVVDYYENMPEHIYKIGQQDFVDKVRAGEEMVIIDIRSAADYEKGHVQGAINMPWGTTAISDNMKKIPQDKEVMIYCYSGQTAGQTVMAMNLAGVNARSVNLGFNFGISKVEGIDDVLTTEISEFGTRTYTIDSEIQEALDGYYKGLEEVKDTPFKNYKVAEDQLATMIDMEEDFYLLSIRSAEDYEKGHIKGAHNVPFHKDFVKNLAGVPEDKKVVVYCYSGQTAGQTVAAMRFLGYDAVSLNGGVGVKSNAPIGWTNTGKELITK